MASEIVAKKDPGSLYAAAIGALHLSPQVQAVLSPVGAQLFTVAYSAAYTAAGGALSSLGDAALKGVISAVGPEVVEAAAGVAKAVAEGIGEAIPAVNLFVAIVQVLDSLPKAKGADTSAQDCALFWSALPGNSGPSDPLTGLTATTPADIFSSSDAWSKDRMPNSALGKCIAAITECDDSSEDGKDGSEDGAIAPNGLLHTCYGNLYLTAFYKGDFPKETRAGIPHEHRAIYRALRFATASNGLDHGVLPYALLMDLLASDYDAGHLPITYIAFLLNNYIYKHYFGRAEDGHFVPVLKQSDCGGPAAQQMATQIVALIQSWKASRSKVDLRKVHPKMRLRLVKPPKPAGPFTLQLWAASTGWRPGPTVPLKDLLGTVTSLPGTYFALYDVKGAILAQGDQSAMLAKVASIVYQ